MIPAIKQMNIYPKLVIIFLLSIMPMYGVSWIMNNMGAASVEKEIVNSTVARAHFYLQSFTFEIDRLADLTRTLAADEDFRKISTTAPYMDDYERTETILRIQEKLSLLKNSSLFVKEARVFVPLLDRTIHTTYFGNALSREELDALKQPAMYPIIHYDDRLLLRMLHPFHTTNGSDPVLAIEVELSKAQIEKSLSQLNSQSGGILEIRGDAWAISTSSGMEARYEPDIGNGYDDERQRLTGSEKTTLDGQSYLVAYERSPALGIGIFMFVPEKLTFGPLNTYRNLFVLLSILSVVIIVMIASGLRRFIRTPLKTLIKTLRKVEKGDLDVSVHIDRRDEFSYLFEQFNSMIYRIRLLIKEVYEQKIRSQRAELKQLQAQINPHFLYNSFFILYQLIQRDEKQNGLTLVKYLRNYFQFITRNASDEVDLSEEFLHALSYLEIQKIRYGCSFAIEADALPERFAGLKVPRLILQPIIENAFQHGLEDKTGMKRLCLRLEAHADRLAIIVEDNGEQLADEKLAELQNRLTSDDAFAETTGLINIHRRLMIKFGGEAGLTLVRSEWSGLKAVMHLPYNGGPIL